MVAAALDSNQVRIAAYLLLAALTGRAWWSERRRSADQDVWPPFWLWSAGLLVMMAIGRTSGLADAVADAGRREALDEGWYADRRSLQAAVVVATGMTWLVVVTAACWRTPPARRRRYLPFGLVVVTLVASAIVRVISLHPIDAVLHRRHLGPVRVGTVIELTQLLVAAAVVMSSTRRGACERRTDVAVGAS